MELKLSPLQIVLSGAFAAWLVLIFVLNDPVLMYVTLMVLTTFAFPEWKMILGICTIYGMFSISMKHDPVHGDGASFIATTAESVTLAIDSTFAYVLLFALIPFLKVLVPPNFSAMGTEIQHSLPLMQLLIAKYFIELQLMDWIGDQLSHMLQMVKDFIRQFKSLTVRYT
nr:hypothetical protein TetV2_00463 [Oceanusvirus sp.]